MAIKNNNLLIRKDEMVLIKNSETTKDKDIYGNMFDTLHNIDKLSEAEFYNNSIFDDKARMVILNNKNMLLDSIKDEWSAVGHSDIAIQDIHCQLCGRKNKYVYFIKNKNNKIELNVGSECIKKFSGLENLRSIKQSVAEKLIKKEKDIRRVEFGKIENEIDFVKKMQYRFENLPIIIPYFLYEKIKESIYNLNFIKTDYITNGGEISDVLDRYRYEKENCKGLLKKAYKFCDRFKENRLSCKKNTANWLLKENKELWIKISKNNGILNSETLKCIYFSEFVNEFINEYRKHIGDKDIQIIKQNGSRLILKIQSKDYQQSLFFNVSNKEFMFYIGYKCLLEDNYYFTKNDLPRVEIDNTPHNVEVIYNRISPIIDKMGYRIYFSNKTGNTYYVKKPQIVQKNKYSRIIFEKEEEYAKFDENFIVINFSSYIFKPDEAIEKMFRVIFTKISFSNRWISKTKMLQDEAIVSEAASMKKQREFLPY